MNTTATATVALSADDLSFAHHRADNGADGVGPLFDTAHKNGASAEIQGALTRSLGSADDLRERLVRQLVEIQRGAVGRELNYRPDH